MAAHRLRPEAEGAARPTPPARVERHVRMQEVADEVLLDHQVALVDVHDERQRVHVLERRPLRRALEVSVRAIAEPRHLRERPSLGDFLDSEVELAARDELDRRRGSEGALALDGDVRPDEADPQPRVSLLERLGDADVVRKRRGARVEHGEVVVPPERHHVPEREPGRRRVDETAAGDERRRLGEPRGVPERPDLAAGLIPGAGAAVEALKRRRMQKEGAQVVGHSPLSYLIHPEGTPAADAEKAGGREPGDDAPRGAPNADDPYPPTARPRIAQPRLVPEEVARLRTLGAEAQDAPPAVDDHRPSPGIPLECAGVLDRTLMSHHVVR